jgi:2-dehydropantoate 2-reductase
MIAFMDEMLSEAGEKVFIIGAGAIGIPLATALAIHGRDVVLVSARDGAKRMSSDARVRFGGEAEMVGVRIEQVPLAELRELTGTVVIAIKAHANEAVAAALASRQVRGELMVMQNGLGVERPFLSCGFDTVLRSVLYVTSQTLPDGTVEFRQIASCPMGVVAGDAGRLAGCVAALSLPRFAFHGHSHIEAEVWRKTVVNAVFNSICPLLEVDNGVFARDAGAVAVARQIIAECVALASDRGGLLDEDEVMEKILKISGGSDGVMISTLQDIRAGRETEIENLNLELARIGAAADPEHALPITGALGRLVLLKSRLRTAIHSLPAR